MKTEYTRPSGVEQKFIDAVIGGQTYSDAYRASHPGHESLSSKQISQKAAQFRREHPRVDEEIKRLHEEAITNARISRDDIIEQITLLFEASIRSATLPLSEDNKLYLASDKAANIALKASERLCKLLGYDEPEKVDSIVTVRFSGEVEDYAE